MTLVVTHVRYLLIGKIMYKKKFFIKIALFISFFLHSNLAKAEQTEELAQKIAILEEKITQLENDSLIDENKLKKQSFNPDIGIILNGQYSNYSSDEYWLPGFATGHGSERSASGFSADHTEFNFGANIDDKFYGSTTFAIASHGDHIHMELEEAYFETLSGMGLPNGFSVKTGRAFWNLGYLNEHHSHADDFADRPLPYRAFLDGTFNDDGMQASYILPTSYYIEAGSGFFRGDDFPHGGNTSQGVGAWSAYLRFGDDIGVNQSYRIGFSTLNGETDLRETNEHAISFAGDSKLYIADFRYTLAPTNNQSNQEIIFQGEYFTRSESGNYTNLTPTPAPAPVSLEDNQSSGWYLQSVYKFTRNWRVGARFSKLTTDDVPLGLDGTQLDANGFDPKSYSAMIDWTNSEFSRIRLQYNHEKLGDDFEDNQILIQYVMTLGAHKAHKY